MEAQQLLESKVKDKTFDERTAIIDSWLTKTGGYAKDMTLRDYYAGKALDRMMAVYFAELTADGEKFRMIENDQVSVTAEMIAEECFAMADAMLKVRVQ